VSNLDPVSLIAIVLGAIAGIAILVRRRNLMIARPWMVGLTLLSLGLTAWLVAIATPDIANALREPNLGGWAGIDRDLYMHATTRWLQGGPFYEAHQLVGPYHVSYGDILYPPVALILVAPFTVVPSVLWWMIPIGITVALIAFWRPSPLVWPLIVLGLIQFSSEVHVFSGNPVIWAVAALALGLEFAWPAAFVLIKPSLLPLALVGIRSRRWWVTLALIGAVSVPFTFMWLDWIVALRNSDAGLAYSLPDLPLVLVPAYAWAGRTRRRSTNDAAAAVSARATEEAPGLHIAHPG
jgi:hypothetical protein